ncbi:hypothetical protein CGLO_17658 [Colletotrichum gloeosporioides Cg-14]|uniref:Uncharacterized protein n=1 Tax=Colletotrichum gloeosporioides (strain Cg-14) TaxID=1237896 RepID=T0KWD9_COLGC|nr:hypothetical protein CGLO_17658 [Colletotrichum gloeosporioides Cg-14]
MVRRRSIASQETVLAATPSPASAAGSGSQQFALTSGHLAMAAAQDSSGRL